jgi:hypothetical protein
MGVRGCGTRWERPSEFDLGLLALGSHATAWTEKFPTPPRLKLPQRRENLRIVPGAESCRFTVGDE